MIGQSLAPYRVTGALGAGGMGEVYRASESEKVPRPLTVVLRWQVGLPR